MAEGGAEEGKVTIMANVRQARLFHRVCFCNPCKLYASYLAATVFL